MTTDKTKDWSRQREAMKKAMDEHREPSFQNAVWFVQAAERRAEWRRRIETFAFFFFPICALVFVVWVLFRLKTAVDDSDQMPLLSAPCESTASSSPASSSSPAA